jgi:hypothetical protein
MPNMTVQKPPRHVCCLCGGVGWLRREERGGYTQEACVCRMIEVMPEWMLEEVVDAEESRRGEGGLRVRVRR